MCFSEGSLMDFRVVMPVHDGLFCVSSPSYFAHSTPLPPVISTPQNTPTYFLTPLGAVPSLLKTTELVH